MADKTQTSRSQSGPKETPEERAAAAAALSSQAQFSTYKVNDDLPDTNPPPGRHVIQERGEPHK